ncbi:MAG: hypothetical protein AAF483_13760 [Planctomycetota bacterium]
MRRILNNQNPIQAGTSVLAKGIATLVVMISLYSTANAQSYAQQLAPTASGMQSSAVTSAFAMQYNGEQYQTVPASNVQTAAHNMRLGEVPTADSAVQPASHLRAARQGRRQDMFNPPPFNPCKTGCNVSAYGQYESLWLDRRGDRFFSLSRGGFIDSGFDYEWGGRYTLGRLFDCVNGFEFVFVGPYDWTRRGTTTGPNSNLTASGGYTAADISNFNNANLHTQTWDAEMYSFELNRKWWVWDVLSTMIGTRYLNYEEDFTLVSQQATGGQGFLLESVDNRLVGLQVGAELLYPMSLRASSGIRAKGGVYANLDRRRSIVRNGANVLVNAADSSTELAGIIEIATFTNYYITPSIRLNGGYEFWYMPGIATVPDQIPGSITPASGTNVSNDDSLILHGVSVGATVLF